MARAMNFNAGPAALPLAALERARDELVEFEGSGMSVMEHSHRGKVYEKVHHEALSLVAELLSVSRDEYDVLFLQGGASMAFATIPMNLLDHGKTADYVVTGAWGDKAVAEARTVGTLMGGRVNVSASTTTTVPKQDDLRLTDGAAYVHCTSNETIHGVEYGLDASTPFPKTDVGDSRTPLFVDMSSDILGRRVDCSQFALIYAGAQKNIGPSGVTIFVVKKSLVERARKDIPVIFQLRTHAKNDSLYNTPPTFGIYLVRNTLSWLKGEGGVEAMETRNKKKAAVIYDAIDASGGFYECPVAKPSRSIMNVVWRLPSEELEEKFVKEATAQKMIGLKGHRSVGGIRASLYNAVEPAWCDALASFMKDFAKAHG